MRSPFCHLVKRDVECAGVTFTIRKLNPKMLERARQVSIAESMRNLREMGGMATFAKELEALKSTMGEQSLEKKIADPMNQYERGELLKSGIVAWTIDTPLEADLVLELDEDVQDTLAREILQLAKPSLFQGEGEQEAARKNG